MVIIIAGVKHWLWRAVDQKGIVLDILVQPRRDKQAAKRLPLQQLAQQKLANPKASGRPCTPTAPMTVPVADGPAMPPIPHISAKVALPATSIEPEKRSPSSTMAIMYIP